jgi:putative transposase
VNPEQEHNKSEQVMDFRYSIIAELLNPYLSRSERRTLMRQKAKRHYEIPYSQRTTLSYGCIRRWYAAFQCFGEEGLRPKVRSDKGICRGLSAEESAAFLQYLEHNPELTAKAAYRKLKEQGVVQTQLSKSALSRLVVAAGLQREERLRENQPRQQLKFAFKYPLECVQADMMHAFELPDGSGRRKRAILLTILDDATRRVLYGAFSFRESSLAVRVRPAARAAGPRENRSGLRR